MNWDNFNIKHFYGIVRVVSILVAKFVVARGWVTK